VAFKLYPSPLALNPISVFSASSEVYRLLKPAASGSFAQKNGSAALLPPARYPTDETANTVKSSLTS